MQINSVEKSFTRSADTYDKFSSVQQETARRLIEMTLGMRAGEILEIGCGTGHYTGLLAGQYPSARITAVDISAAMVRRALEKQAGQGVNFLVMDAEEMTGGQAYDIITSNACFHWLRDVDSALARHASMIRPGGVLTASVFGPRTFFQLMESLSMTGKAVSFRPREFPSLEGLRKTAERNFARCEVSEVFYSHEFDSVMDILRAIKYSGVRGDAHAPGFLFTPDLVRKVEEHYRREYGSLEATFQVFYVRAYV